MAKSNPTLVYNPFQFHSKFQGRLRHKALNRKRMPTTKRWSRWQLLVALNLYCRIPFGKLHSRNPEIIHWAGRIGRKPGALAMKLVNIASLDPGVTRTGRKGLSNASKLDRQMWEEMQDDWDAFVEDSDRTMRSLPGNAPGPDSSAQPIVGDYRGESRLALTRVRVGQEFFRESILSAYDEKCCITGLAIPKLLVASHIIPWSVDESNRLNPRNGLALSMLHDKAFDAGMITIAKDMTVLVSRKVAEREDPFFNESIRLFDGKEITLPRKFRPDPAFLAYHRENIFDR